MNWQMSEIGERATWPIWEGRDFKQIQVWRSPEGMIVIENPNRLGQIAFTPAQWAKVTEHVAPEEEESSGDAR